MLQPKLDAVAFGVFVPIFFIVTGMRFDLDAVVGDTAGLAKPILFLAPFLVVLGGARLPRRRRGGAPHVAIIRPDCRPWEP